MREISFRGVFTAMVTPFTKKDNLDEQRLEEIIEAQIQSGVDGLVPCGTTGESPTLSHDEHDRVIALTVKFANGRVPVIAGTGSNATTEAIRLSRHAQQVGADAVLLVTPTTTSQPREACSSTSRRLLKASTSRAFSTTSRAEPE